MFYLDWYRLLRTIEVRRLYIKSVEAIGGEGVGGGLHMGKKVGGGLLTIHEVDGMS